MTVADVARKEFADAVRSRALWVATVIFLGMIALTQAIVVTVVEDPDPKLAARFLEGPATEIVLPMLGLLLGYQAIVGERESGNLRFLLGLPHSRRDVILGKFLGRTAVLSVAILGGFLTAVGLIVATVGVPPLVPIAAYVLFVLLSAAAIVAIAIAISAIVDTRTRAISVAVGGFLLATVLWSYVIDGIHYVVTREFPGADPPTWLAVVDHLNPLTVLGTSADVLLPEASQIAITVTEDGASATQAEQTPSGATDALVHEPAFLAAVLVLWTVVPLAVGYLRFRSADLS
ncbi:ABC transporter permease subunit [Natronococcus occultus]|uniref:ABC-type transport system involved in multi-copper enzyme maturation, permease component n=1 Tax=Natronococcus occultus SP4 TaxID=694430 RepID=L0K2I9_9EURY|nr:ABC transporter permease subunit [Natronococcus occultus]AGB38298.1 ABC-type transport system involved in multi-copper enzyme maturation, permease component [Natronococcus occultus SP4]